jgi:hypothetical protein
MLARLGLASLHRALVVSAATCSVTACWSGASSEDDGSICIAAQPKGTGAVRLTSAAPLALSVSTSACLSSACTRSRRASCSVVLSGSELFVSSHFHWEERGAYPNGCTDDCVALNAQCEAPPLPSGTYVVRHGDDAFTLQIPSQLASGCLSTP